MDLPAVQGEEDYLDFRENQLRPRRDMRRLNVILTGGYLLAGMLVAGGILAWRYWARH